MIRRTSVPDSLKDEQTGSATGDGQKLAHWVADRLREEILSGALEPGAALLREKQMMERFKVSRPTLRAAKGILETELLISVGRGSRRAVVRAPANDRTIAYAGLVLAAEGVTIEDLQRARLYFEAPIIESLSGRKLRDAVGELKQCMRAMEAAHAEGRHLDVIAEVNHFHAALVRASGNKAMILIVSIVRAMAAEAAAAAVETGRLDARMLERAQQRTISGYCTLCRLLDQGATAEAATFWRLHMGRLLRFLRRSGIGAYLVLPPANLRRF